jgi:hypothetical protein
MNCKDFNSCRALLYKAWETDRNHEGLMKLMKNLKEAETKKM